MAGLILFTTSTCVHCKPMKDSLESIKAQYEDEPFDFVTKVIDQDPEARDMAINWGVQGVPTTIFFQDAQEVDRIVGAVPAGVVGEYVERYLQRDVLQESPGGVGVASSSVLCGSSEQEDNGARGA